MQKTVSHGSVCVCVCVFNVDAANKFIADGSNVDIVNDYMSDKHMLKLH